MLCRGCGGASCPGSSALLHRQHKGRCMGTAGLGFVSMGAQALKSDPTALGLPRRSTRWGLCCSVGGGQGRRPRLGKISSTGELHDPFSSLLHPQTPGGPLPHPRAGELTALCALGCATGLLNAAVGSAGTRQSSSLHPAGTPFCTAAALDAPCCQHGEQLPSVLPALCSLSVLEKTKKQKNTTIFGWKKKEKVLPAAPARSDGP